MNEEQRLESELLSKIISMLNETSEYTRQRVLEKVSNYKEELNADPIGVITNCLKEVQLDAEKELDALYSKNASQLDNGTVKTINDDLEKGKAFVRTMSSQAREQDELIQQRREERYQQMIDEVGEIESPVNRIHH